MKGIIKILVLSLIFASTISNKVFAENIDIKKTFTLEGGGFPIIGSVSGNLNIKFGFNMENTTLLLLARENYYIGGPSSYSYKNSTGNTIMTPISQIYFNRTDFQLQERYYPLKKSGLVQPFITVGLGIELPSTETGDWHIPIPVILGNVGTDIMFNESFGINLILNASFPRGITPEANLKLSF